MKTPNKNPDYDIAILGAKKGGKLLVDVPSYAELRSNKCLAFPFSIVPSYRQSGIAAIALVENATEYYAIMAGRETDKRSVGRPKKVKQDSARDGNEVSQWYPYRQGQSTTYSKVYLPLVGELPTSCNRKAIFAKNGLDVQGCDCEECNERIAALCVKYANVAWDTEE